MSASRYDLLPPNATPLERDFSRVTSSLVRSGPPVPLIRTAKRTNIPDSVVPWLIYEYGLGEILPYLGNNQRRAIAEGVLWQRIRGTPEAVRIALGWINITGLVEESEGGTYRWAEYQLGLTAGTTGEQIIDDIVGVTRISSPVRSRLQRIYAVYDFRRFVLDDSLLSDGGMLSDHSGVRPNPNWPQISYGQIISSLVEDDTQVASGQTAISSQLVQNFDRFILDHSLIDEDWHTLNRPALLTTLECISGFYQGQTWAAVTWQPTAWGDVNAVASSSTTPPVVIAFPTGGDSVYTTTESGTTYRVHEFRTVGSSTLTVPIGLSVQYLIVAGGGGGGGGFQGGGGGAGGLLAGTVSISSGSFTITVGSGGTGCKQGGANVIPTSGGNSSIQTIATAIGGGRGGSEIAGATAPTTGGSGGGGSHGVLAGAAGTTGQGFAGGNGLSTGALSGGGGGGAGGPGTSATVGVAAPAGGPGAQSIITGVTVTYAAGGAGRNRANAGDGTSGANNTGNGGNAGSGGSGLGGNGGSGIVIIKYAI